jgi:hypothetical protein
MGGGGSRIRPGAWRLSLPALAAGVAARVWLVLAVQVVHGNFAFLDDQGYDQTGWSLAQAWHAGIFPPPGSAAYAGTLSYLWYVFVAAVYFAVGRHWLVVKLAAALLSSLSVPAAASIGLSLGGRRLGVRAAWVAAVYPGAVFWGSTGLKDGPMAALLLAVAAIALRPLTAWRLAAATGLLAAAFLCRPVEGAAVAAMLAVPALALVRRCSPDPLRLAALGCTVTTAAVVLAAQAGRYLPALDATVSGTGSLSLASGAVSISYIPSPGSVLRNLAGPFPWAYGPGTDTVYRALYPGMVVWLLLLPACALGCAEIARRGTWAARGVVVSALVFVYAYLAVFASAGFFRQRFTAEVLFLVIALHAFEVAPRRAAVWTAAGACLTTTAALVQSRVIPLHAMALILAAAGAWLAARRYRAKLSVDRHPRVRGGGQHVR